MFEGLQILTRQLLVQYLYPFHNISAKDTEFISSWAQLWLLLRSKGSLPDIHRSQPHGTSIFFFFFGIFRAAPVAYGGSQLGVESEL